MSTGGTGGTAGGGNDPGCPAMAPEGENPACMEDQLGSICNWGATSCACSGQASDPTWRCRTNAETCPTTVPAEETPCPDVPENSDACLYGRTVCGCTGDTAAEQEWQCFTFPDDNGMGGAAGAAGAAGGGNPGPVTCPDTAPTPPGTCTGFGRCEYDDAVCFCSNADWTCFPTGPRT
jgi:hypothetical protein